MADQFLVQALVYLAVAVVCVPPLKRLGLSAVLGFLISGILIGPFVMGLAGEEGAHLMHVAEFGVVMMLFLIGLELDPAAFWKMRKLVVGFGLAQLAGSVLLLTVLFMSIHLQWTNALAVGLAFTMSSTAIVMQNLKEKGLLKSQAGKASFAVLLFQDIAVIPILAALPLLVVFSGNALPSDSASHAGHNLLEDFPAWIRTIAMLGSVTGIYFTGTYVVAPLLRFVSKTGLREMFTASALLLVVAVAFLMELVGLSPALGAFVAGVVLANSEFRHELESDIEPFKGLLLGLFFMTVGVSINFRLLSDFPVQILLLTIATVAVKFFILFVVGRAFKLSLPQNLLFSLGLCQVGEFAFVVLSFSNQIHLLSEEWLGKLNAVTALSMMITPLLLIVNEKWITPIFESKISEEATPHDNLDHGGKVIIAGYGHFGSTVGRLLEASKVRLTVLDVDIDQVQMLRKFGHTAYYGDATRTELLHTAGIEDAVLFIAATGSPSANLQLVKTVHKIAPGVKIMARARNRLDAYEFMDLGVTHIYRETLHTSVKMAIDALVLNGFLEHTAQQLGERFLRYDEEAMPKLAAQRNNETLYANSIRQEIEAQQTLLQNDLQQLKDGS